MKSFESVRKTIAPRRVKVVGLLALAACSEPADTSPLNAADEAFISEAEAIYVYPGEMGTVPTVQHELRNQYNKYRFVEQRDFGDDKKNILTFKPNRFETAFDDGDGSGADTVCERLTVPEDAKYVAATTDSGEESWIYLNESGTVAHICYDDSNNPLAVLAWAGNEDR